MILSFQESSSTEGRMDIWNSQYERRFQCSCFPYNAQNPKISPFPIFFPPIKHTITNPRNQPNRRRNARIYTFTWWIGGYMELVHTGHSSNSWTLVAGAVTGGTTPFWRGLDENWWTAWLWLRLWWWWWWWWWRWWISSSSMPSDEDTHSILSTSINTGLEPF